MHPQVQRGHPVGSLAAIPGDEQPCFPSSAARGIDQRLCPQSSNHLLRGILDASATQFAPAINQDLGMAGIAPWHFLTQVQVVEFASGRDGIVMAGSSELSEVL